MNITIDNINFPDDVFRSYVKNNIAAGNSILTDDMRVSHIDISDLGVKDITGIEYLIDPDALFCSIDLLRNMIPYYDFEALEQKTTRLSVSAIWQLLKLPANKIIMSGDFDFPYHINLNDYLPVDKCTSLSVTGTISNGDLSGTLYDGSDFKIENGILKSKCHVREIQYSYSTNNCSGHGWIIRDPYINYPAINTIGKAKFHWNDSVSGKPTLFKLDEEIWGKRFSFIDTTLPVTWSVVEGELPPGLTLNPTTGEISGVIS